MAQLELDAASASFTAQATDPAALASMTLGSLAFRFTKLLALQGLGAFAPRIFAQAASSTLALGGEVTVFRTSQSLVAGGDFVAAFERRGFLGTSLDFAVLKLLAPLGARNLILGNFSQSAAVVAGHELSAEWGLAEREKGGLLAKFLRAQATNWAMSAGSSLFHTLGGGRLHGLERALHARTESLGARPSRSWEGLTRNPEPIGLFRLASEDERADIRANVEKRLQGKSRRFVNSRLVHLGIQIRRLEGSHCFSTEELELYRYEHGLLREAWERLPAPDERSALSLEEIEAKLGDLQPQHADPLLDSLEFHLQRILSAGSLAEIPSYLRVLSSVSERLKLSKAKAECAHFLDAAFRDPREIQAFQTWHTEWQGLTSEGRQQLMHAKFISLLHEAPASLVDPFLGGVLKSKATEAIKDQAFFLIFHEGRPAASTVEYYAQNARHQKPNQRAYVLGKHGQQANSYARWREIQERLLALTATPRIEYRALEALEENPHRRIERQKEARRLALALDLSEDIREDDLRDAYAHLGRAFARRAASLLRARDTELPPDAGLLVDLRGLAEICRDIPGPLPSLETLEALAETALRLYEATGDAVQSKKVFFPSSIDGGHYLIGPTSCAHYCERIGRQLEAMRDLLGAGIGNWMDGSLKIEAEIPMEDGMDMAYQIGLRQGAHESYHGLRIAIFPRDKSGVFDYLAKIDLNIHGTRIVIDAIQALGSPKPSEPSLGFSGSPVFNQLLVLTARWASRLGYEEIALVNETNQFAYQDQMRKRGQAGGGVYSNLQQLYFRGARREGAYYILSLKDLPSTWHQVVLSPALNQAMEAIEAKMRILQTDNSQSIHLHDYLPVGREYHPSSANFTSLVFEDLSRQGKQSRVLLFADRQKAELFLARSPLGGRLEEALCIEANGETAAFELSDRYLRISRRPHPLFEAIQEGQSVYIAVEESTEG